MKRYSSNHDLYHWYKLLIVHSNQFPLPVSCYMTNSTWFLTIRQFKAIGISQQIFSSINGDHSSNKRLLFGILKTSAQLTLADSVLALIQLTSPITIAIAGALIATPSTDFACLFLDVQLWALVNSLANSFSSSFPIKKQKIIIINE